MLDATQAAIVAYMTEHGEIIHESHLPDDVIEQAEQAALDAGEPRGVGWRIFDESVRDQGYQALIRYSISEMESERAYDVENYPQGYSDDLVDWLERKDHLQDLLDELKDSGIGTPQPGVSVLEDLIYEMDAQIEATVEDLSKVHCDQCHDPIE